MGSVPLMSTGECFRGSQVTYVAKLTHLNIIKKFIEQTFTPTSSTYLHGMTLDTRIAEAFKLLGVLSGSVLFHTDCEFYIRSAHF
jgi:hypothetical protein